MHSLPFFTVILEARSWFPSIKETPFIAGMLLKAPSFLPVPLGERGLRLSVGRGNRILCRRDVPFLCTWTCANIQPLMTSLSDSFLNHLVGCTPRVDWVRPRLLCTSSPRGTASSSVRSHWRTRPTGAAGRLEVSLTCSGTGSSWGTPWPSCSSGNYIYWVLADLRRRLLKLYW